MSFASEFAPRVKGFGWRSRPLWTFCTTFIFMSSVVTMISISIGDDFAGVASESTRALVVAGLLAALLLIDVAMIVKGARYSLGVSRQTPQVWRYRRFAAAGWGLDAGLMVTTFRTTSLTWMAMGLAVLGFGSLNFVWIYGVSFCLGLMVVIGTGDPTSDTFSRRVLHSQKVVRGGSLVAAMPVILVYLWQA